MLIILIVLRPRGSRTFFDRFIVIVVVVVVVVVVASIVVADRHVDKTLDQTFH
ncbi:hypothetical protein BVRB_5g105620 [Beta vulgaris subsp. vulgaris]|uniref:Uncharacterized protein n=1 Tax=Beta vulgaris subsp. vulgaris TaxID=3555 RepID=A0A0J8CDX0_BETVV|nr:hypothetical protein BVRB_5g105620 [Beta vulgaris subsp. vulgaris]